MSDLVPVTLAGILMDNEPDANGVRWRVLKDGLPGWAAPAVDAPRQALTSQHGAAPAGRWYRQRSLTVRGRAKAPTFETAWDAYYQLLEAVALGLLTDIIVGEPVPKQLMVELEDEPDIADPSGDDSRGWRVPFQLPLVADYPFKRGLTPVTVSIAAGTTGGFTAAGNAAAEIEVTTTTTGTVELMIAGLTLRTSEVPAGTVLTSGPGFTHPKRTVIGPAGENLFGTTLSPMQWPAVVAGANAPVNGGTANFDLTFHPTYR